MAAAEHRAFRAGSIIERARALGLGRRGVVIGLAALAVAFAWSMWAQYHWLGQASDASESVLRQALEGRLATVAADVENRFVAESLSALAGPADAIIPAVDDDDVVRYFASAPPEGVRVYYLFSLRYDKRLKVTMYDPRRRAIASEGYLQQFGGARNGSLVWMYSLEDHAPADAKRIEVYEPSPMDLVVSRAVLDASGATVGVAGVIYDPDYLRDTYLPEAVRTAAERENLDSPLEHASISVVDSTGSEVSATADASGRRPEVSIPLRFPFPEWRLAATPLGADPKTVARAQFVYGTAQMLLCALLLVVGVVLTARASALEVRALRMRADFVSNMTHELQTPLTSIQLHAELLRSGRLGGHEQIEECGEHLGRDADRLSRLVGNILDFARIDAGKKTYRFREVDLVEIVEDVLDAAYVLLEHEGLFLDFQPPADPLPPIAADQAAVAQAVSNVLDNAIKWSTAPATIVVRCGADEGSGEGGTAWVSIADSGPGIARDEQQRIFERFYRVHTGLVHDVKGSGIGLALVKHVVDAHGGGVDVDSEPGRGSVFTLHFRTTNDALGNAARARTAASTAAPPLKHQKHADDETAHR